MSGLSEAWKARLGMVCPSDKVRYAIGTEFRSKLKIDLAQDINSAEVEKPLAREYLCDFLWDQESRRPPYIWKSKVLFKTEKTQLHIVIRTRSHEPREAIDWSSGRLRKSCYPRIANKLRSWLKSLEREPLHPGEKLWSLVEDEALQSPARGWLKHGAGSAESYLILLCLLSSLPLLSIQRAGEAGIWSRWMEKEKEWNSFMFWSLFFDPE